MTSHMDAETLALSAEGLLDEAEESSVQGHLAGCEQCNEQLTALADVSRLLGAAPAPELPADAAARIEEAVRAEAEKRDTTSGTDAEPSQPPGGDGVVPFKRRPGRWLPYLVGAAAAVFVIGGAGAVLHSTLTSEDGASQANPEVSGGEPPDAALSYQPVVLESETEYTEDDLDDQAMEILATVPADSHPSGPEGDTEGSADSSGGDDSPEMPEDVSTCAHEFGEVNDEALPALVDIAKFRPADGGAAEDAWVMYYGSDPAGEFDVMVVSPSCADGDPGDSVLARTMAPAP